ncbi:uncharacterized protein LOC142330490 [Lycorma delicatula]|uniref:uncharacterized protein LOC142330490 n=1 Tax=Lycorma delicatula TaxID=130591 RepID=UPI003F515023
MTQSFACRKRCRSNCEEESSEFTPLSKRINNLHINNTFLTTAASVPETPLLHHHHHNQCQDDGNPVCPIMANHRHHHIGIDAVDSSQWNGLVNTISTDIPIINHNISMNQREVTQVQQISRHLQDPLIPHYNPDLTPSENPYYYENNRLLFTLYMERLQRTNNNQL